MPKNERVLVAFDVSSQIPSNQNLHELLRGDDWKTERNILKTLKELEYDFEVIPVFNDLEVLAEKIRTYEPHIIFNLVESFKNSSHHERDITSFFKLTGIPFTGCGPTGITLCKNKGLSKEILSHHKIRIPHFVILKRKKPIHKPSHLKFPLIVKPLREEASYGISQASIVENEEQFQERVKYVQDSLNQDVIAEEFIDGRELYVSILGHKQLDAFPIRELKFHQAPEGSPKIATFKAKWDEKYRKKWGIQNRFANLDSEVEEKIKKMCKKIYQHLSIRGYGRIDLRLKEDGEIVFLEANPNPILAQEEDFAESAKKGGLTYPDLIQKIINLSKPESED